MWYPKRTVDGEDRLALSEVRDPELFAVALIVAFGVIVAAIDVVSGVMRMKNVYGAVSPEVQWRRPPARSTAWTPSCPP